MEKSAKQKYKKVCGMYTKGINIENSALLYDYVAHSRSPKYVVEQTQCFLLNKHDVFCCNNKT